MILEGFVAAAAAVILYLIVKRQGQWLSAGKRIRGSNSQVYISVSTDLNLVKFTDVPAKENPKKPLEFIRKNIKKGETLEFEYPASKKNITIIAQKGPEEKKFEIGVH